MNKMYQERVFSGVLGILPGGIGIILLGLFISNQFNGFLESSFASGIFLGIGLFLILVSLNFAFLTIRISSNGVSTRFGIISHNLSANDIAGAYEDKTSSVAYGGFGIRFGSVNGKRRLVYNVPNAPRIVLQQRFENNQEFVFSTRNPEAVMRVIQESSRA